MNVVDPNEGSVGDSTPKPRRSRGIKIILLIIAILVVYYIWKSINAKKKEGVTGRLLSGIRGFDRGGNPFMEDDSDDLGGLLARNPRDKTTLADPGLGEETDESLLELAKAVQQAGLVMQGTSWCRATQMQREMFGDRSSPARRIIEQQYVECRTRDMCPDIEGYPTWVKGNRLKRPGFKNPRALRELIKEASALESRDMLQDSAEPNEENIPDAQHAVRAPKALTPDDAKKLFYQMMRDYESSKNASAVAAAEADREAVTRDAGAQVEGAGGSEPGCGDDKPNKKEYIRGVAAYAPLNVPNMPGTAPMNLDLQHADFQTYQGNAPRAVIENHAPRADLVRQVVQSFNGTVDAQARHPMAPTFSENRQPQSVKITTGEAFDDKSLENMN